MRDYALSFFRVNFFSDTNVIYIAICAIETIVQTKMLRVLCSVAITANYETVDVLRIGERSFIQTKVPLSRHVD